MSGTSTDSAGREQRLDQLIADYLQAVQSGQVPDRRQLLAEHPEFATELTSFFTDQDRFQELAEPLRAAAVAGDIADTPTLGLTDKAPAQSVLDRIRYFGDYELLEEIARGGMGVVYKARQVSLNRLVALKMILAGQLASEADVRRFRSEAEAAANLDHPHIVPIYEIGEHAGFQYFSMKLIPGGSLADELTAMRAARAEPANGSVGEKTRPAEPRMNPSLAARLMAMVARAVHYAHQRGILHRDLKPANILLSFAPSVSSRPGSLEPDELDAGSESLERVVPAITDFGLAKRVEKDPQLTQSGSIVGTPSYMAPEQAAGNTAISTAADVYSLGAVLYELLTGRPPFQGRSQLETLLQVLETDPVRPRSLDARVDRDLETIALKCLEKDPSRRYGSADALAEDLERWRAGEPIRARSSGRLERLGKWVRRHPAVSGLTTAIMLVACTGIAGIVWQWRDARSAERLAVARELSEREAKVAAIAATNRETVARQHESRARDVAEKAQANEARARQDERLAKEKALADRDAKAQALERADGLRISAEAAAVRPFDPGLSLLLSLDSVRRVPNQLAFNVLYDALDDLREVRTLQANPSGVTWARFTADGRFLVAVGRAGHYTSDPQPCGRVWDLANGEVVAQWPGRHEDIADVDVSPDSSRVVTTSLGYQAVYYRDGKLPPKHVFTDRVAYVWDPSTGKETVHLRRHQDRVVSARFSPDGKQIVTCSFDRTARIWDAESGRELRVLEGHQMALRLAIFSPDGGRILTLSSSRNQSTGHGHDAEATQPDSFVDPGVVERVGTFGESGASTFSLSGLGADNLAILWDATAGRKLLSLAKRRPGFLQFGHVWHPTTTSFSPDGKSVAIAFEEHDVAIWDATLGDAIAPTRYERRVLKGHTGSVLGLAFSPDGKRLATCGSDTTVRIWDTQSGTERLRLRAHAGPVQGVQFSPDGQLLLSRSDDKTARLWNVDSGEQVALLAGHADKVTSATFRPDGRQIVTAGDSTVRVWELDRREAATVLRGHAGPITALAFSPDGQRLLTASTDESVRLWDVPSGQPGLVLGKEKVLGEIRSAHFDREGQWLVTASANSRGVADGNVVSESSVHIWDAASGTDLLALKEHGEGARSAQLSVDRKRLVTVSDGYVRNQGGTIQSTLPQGGLAGFKLDQIFSSVGPGNAGQARVFDAQTGQLIATLPQLAAERTSPRFSPDGQRILVVSAGERAVCLMDAATGKEVLTLRKLAAWGDVLAEFSPQGGLLATASNQQASLWSADTGQLLASFENFMAPVRHICFSHDGQRLALSSGSMTFVWTTATRELIATLQGHQGAVNTAAFSPDGKRLLTGADDKTAVLWDVGTHKMLAYYRGHTDAVSQVAFRPDGSLVATAGPDGTARLWPVDLLASVAQRLPRQLTTTERSRFEIHANPPTDSGLSAGPSPTVTPPPGTELPPPLVSPLPPPGLETAQQLRQRLAQLPSPLDWLNASQIHSQDRFDWQPAELVAVLGEHRHRHFGYVQKLALSADAKLVASADSGGTIQVWDTSTLERRATRQGSLLGFAADAPVLLVLADKTVQSWDLSGDEPQLLRSLPIDATSAEAFHPGKQAFVGQNEAGIQVLWDLGQDPAVSRGPVGGSGHNYHLQFSPDGKYLVGCVPGPKALLWDVTGSEPRQLVTLDGNREFGIQVCFSADSQTLVITGPQDTLRFLDLTQPVPKERAVLLQSQFPAGYGALGLSANGEILAVSSWINHEIKTGIKLFDLTGPEPKEFALLRGHDGVEALIFTPDGKTLVSGGDSTIRFWDLTASLVREKADWKGHTHLVHGLAFAPDRPLLASSSWDGSLRLWNLGLRETGAGLTNGQPVHEQVLPGGARDLSFSPDGKSLLAGSMFAPQIWDLTEPQPRLEREFPGHTSGPIAQARSLDGRWLASGSVGMCLYDLLPQEPDQPPRLVAELRPEHETASGVNSLAFSPDGTLLIAGGRFGEEPLRAWRLTAGELHPAPLPATRARDLALTPDGMRLVFHGGFDSTTHVWNLDSPLPTDSLLLRGLNSNEVTLAMGPDGRLVAGAGSDGLVTVWDLISGEQIHTWKLPGRVAALAFAPDSHHLALGNANGTIYILRLPAVKARDSAN